MLRLTLSCLAFAAYLGTIASAKGSPAIPVAHISLPDPAYIGMPIWMTVESGTGYKFHYPSSTTPNDFYCNKVEVQRDRNIVEPIIGFPPAGRAGPACGWLGVAGTAESRLPIHLQFPLTEPGTYKVRFTRQQYRNAGIEIAEQSEWTPFRLELAPPDKTERWLEDALGALPESPGSLLGDALPSLLASHDVRVLNVMLEKTYHENSAVAGYGANSLTYFDKQQVQTRVLSFLRERGPNEALGYLFTTSDIAKPIATQIVTVSLPYLRSSDPKKVIGALHVLSMLRDPAFHLPPEIVEEIATKLEGAVDFVVQQKNEQGAWWLANFLGSARRPAYRSLLWKLVDAGLAKEQSLICVTWFRDPVDLPRITEIVKQAAFNNPSDPHGYEPTGVVEHLHTEYGSAARPYLRDILVSSKQTWVRTSAAKGLVLMNDRAGWQFFIDVVRERPFYKDEMLRWIKDYFPAVRNANDAELLRLLESKASASSTAN